MKLEAADNDALKARWKVVRTDFCTDVPGEIVSADEATGECTMRYGGKTETLTLGPGGMRIVGRGRAF